LEYAGVSRDVLPFAIARILKVQLQIDPSNSNMNQSTLVDYITVYESQNEKKKKRVDY